jgi:hypothetical protein
MSYNKSLDECELVELIREVQARIFNAKRGDCTYCLRPINIEPSCRMTERHEGKDHKRLLQFDGIIK